jgi:hypothetical protein
MPGINLRFHSEVTCSECGAKIADAGDYSTLMSEDGAVILFSDAQTHADLAIALECPSGHRTDPPDDCNVEWWFVTAPKTPSAIARAIALL